MSAEGRTIVTYDGRAFTIVDAAAATRLVRDGVLGVAYREGDTTFCEIADVDVTLEAFLAMSGAVEVPVGAPRKEAGDRRLIFKGSPHTTTRP